MSRTQTIEQLKRTGFGINQIEFIDKSLNGSDEDIDRAVFYLESSGLRAVEIEMIISGLILGR